MKTTLVRRHREIQFDTGVAALPFTEVAHTDGDQPMVLQEAPMDTRVAPADLDAPPTGWLASSRELMARTTRDEDYLGGTRERDRFVRGLLLARYGDRPNEFWTVELGPGSTPTVAETMRGRGRYLGVDYNRPFLAKQKEYVEEKGYLCPQAHQTVGHMRALPVRNGCADLVIASCNPALIGLLPDGWRQEAYAEAARILKTGGELLIFPWDPERHRAPGSRSDWPPALPPRRR
ncbi:MAG: class I SAM-dependent methyltransferase [Armatimonadetes bacterium]|nr:class I SAM-dependent methyltransferase [Armatimonadota bacterium]